MQTTTDISTAALLNETLITFGQAARRLPPSRGGKPVNPSTPFRWARDGIRRRDGVLIHLESVRLGGRWLTSAEALARFSARLSAPSDGDRPVRPSPDHRTPAQRERAGERAGSELEREGV